MIYVLCDCKRVIEFQIPNVVLLALDGDQRDQGICFIVLLVLFGWINVSDVFLRLSSCLKKVFSEGDTAKEECVRRCFIFLSVCMCVLQREREIHQVKISNRKKCASAAVFPVEG